MKIKTLTIVGVGLIGGSIGLAAKRRGAAERVIGVGRKRESLERSRDLGAVDEFHLDLLRGVAEAEIVVFCTPVNQIAEQVLATARNCSPDTLLTDAGSTKAAIVRQVEKELTGVVTFVGSHPLAGSEKRGSDFADADLFRDRLTIVTRTPQTDAKALERTSSFWRALGSRVQIMDPEEHDRTLALTSHLPHLLASALAGILPPELQAFTASGFRDTTRVAAGDPSLWTGIFDHNRAGVLEALAKLQVRLHDIESALQAGDWPALTELLTQAKKVRDALGS
jgi:cyclohexadieny/prephenate dehydrogenase